MGARSRRDGVAGGGFGTAEGHVADLQRQRYPAQVIKQIRRGDIVAPPASRRGGALPYFHPRAVDLAFDAEGVGSGRGIPGKGRGIAVVIASGHQTGRLIRHIADICQRHIVAAPALVGDLIARPVGRGQGRPVRQAAEGPVMRR